MGATRLTSFSSFGPALRAPGPQLLPDRACGQAVTGEVARHSQHGGGVEKRRALAYDSLKVLVRVEGAPGLEQEPAELVAQIVERGTQRESRFVLRYGLVDTTRLEVGLSQ